MNIIIVLEYILVITFFIYFTVSMILFVIHNKEKNHNKNEDKNEDEKSNKNEDDNLGCITEGLIMILTFFSLVAIICCINVMIPFSILIWVISPIIFAFVSQRLYFFLKSTRDFRKVIYNESEDKLSIQEKYTVFAFSFVVSALVVYDLMYNLSGKILRLITTSVSGYCGEILYIVIFCILTYVIVFIFCITFSDLSSSIYRGLQIIRRHIGEISFFIAIVCFSKRTVRSNEFFQLFLVKKLKTLNNRFIIVLLYPFLIVLESFLQALLIIFGIIKSGIAYFILLLMFIYDETIILFKCISKISQRKVIKIMFRFSLIIAVATTVIMNRIVPIYTLSKNVTAIVEFIGSAIIIPLILESIIMLKRKHN